MKLLRLSSAAILIAPLLPALAQDSAPPATVTPAATKITPGPHDSYFEYETLQLADENLNQLDPETRSKFEFASGKPRAAEKDFPLCKVFPGDEAYPSEQLINILDDLLGKALSKSVPVASVCYEGPLYDAAECEHVAANFNNSYFTTEDPIEVLSPIYQGMSCMPTTDPTESCTLGGYPSFAVNAQNVAQIQLAVNFARNTGMRLVVKNTGHDFSGKSSGAGALSIWTHNLKDIEFIPDYFGPGSGWSGPAIKAGAGVQAFELYEEADRNGVVVVGGEGETVGIMGGYILGGGHSPLGSLYGMGADQVLSMEVVTPDGKFVTASFTQNKELFWALRGGGGSTFGVVTSVTVKAYPDMPTTSSTFTFSSGGEISLPTFWQAIRYYFDYFIPHTDAGIYSYFFILPTGPNPQDRTFVMQPFFAPNKTTSDVESLLSPWLTQLSSLGIPITPNTTTYPSFHSAWKSSFPLEILDKTHGADGSRLFPRSNWADKPTLDATFEAWKTSSDNGLSLISFNIAPTLSRGGNPDNAVNPAWRSTLMHSIQSVSWPSNATVDEIKSARDAFTNGDMQRWRDVTPGSGAYLGESDRMEPGFQQAFYGEGVYERLLGVKREVDPWEVFWAATAVGSEGWEVRTEDGLPGEDGRLCRV
ncbi:hypothetical protein FQN54_009400 [Arachnomyces sp. PD_36]|nr:hypothetical protein FQN54_009400 [Arachnomyces sp. PD_36]